MKSIMRLVSLVLVVGGIALLIYGLISHSGLQDSLKNQVVNLLAGKTDEEKQAIGMAIGGGAAALIGVGLFFAGGKAKKRKKR